MLKTQRSCLRTVHSSKGAWLCKLSLAKQPLSTSSVVLMKMFSQRDGKEKREGDEQVCLFLCVVCV